MTQTGANGASEEASEHLTTQAVVNTAGVDDAASGLTQRAQALTGKDLTFNAELEVR